MKFTVHVPTDILGADNLYSLIMAEIGADSCTVLTVHDNIHNHRYCKVCFTINDGGLWRRSEGEHHEIQVSRKDAGSRRKVYCTIRDYLRAYYL